MLVNAFNQQSSFVIQNIQLALDDMKKFMEQLYTDIANLPYKNPMKFADVIVEVKYANASQQQGNPQIQNNFLSSILIVTLSNQQYILTFDRL